MAPQELLALADRVDSQRGVSNKLDAEIEIALFNPPEDGFASVRRNNAGSKLIYTHHDGREVTSWAMDWTMDRPRSSGLLRALATSRSQQEGASS